MANLSSCLFFKNTKLLSCYAFRYRTPIVKPPRELLLVVSELGIHLDSRSLLKWKSGGRIFSAPETTASPTESCDSGRYSEAFTFDDFLSVLEFMALVSTAAISIYIASSRLLLPNGGILGINVLVGQYALLVSCVVLGAAIRRRQWRRTTANTGHLNLPVRVEKLAADLRSSAAILSVLNRQIDKLGIRIRDSRKALKDPIAQTSALAQRNSQKTRALAAEREALGRELVEIQNLLLAIQEQQRKQLELILAVGKALNLWGP